MIDARLLPLQRRLMDKPAHWLVSRGIRADQVTVTGFILGLAGAAAAAGGLFGLALMGLVLNRLADGLDGAIARQTQTTDRGAFLDITLDFVFYAVFPIGFALHDPGQNALAVAVLIASFVGTGSSFLAFSVIAERRGLTADAYPTKGITYLGGLTEGAETIAVFVAFCLFPTAFPVLAYAFAGACVVTMGTRWIMGYRAFGDG